MLSRWKIVDNLRRSLVPASLVLLLLFCWLRLSQPWAWTLAILGTIFAPIFLSSLLDLLLKPEDVALRQRSSEVVRSFGRHSAQGLFTFACMPYEAFFSLDAIFRAIWRMLFSHRHLLEWNASSEHKHKGRPGLADSFQYMWPAPAFALAALICVAVIRPIALGVAVPILLLWFASPVVAWWISVPLKRETARLSLEQAIFLRKLSRKTWSFFEKFVGSEDHWLPPDNYQEGPAPAIGHRTSPTNMGLALLANLSAYDFGYLSAAQLLQRTDQAFETMGLLERHRGHFYNWYETQTLKPLSPLYVSTVDSGNLVAHVLTLEPGLVGLVDQKILAPRLFTGLLDTIGVFTDVVSEGVSHDNERIKTTLLYAADLRKDLDGLCVSPPTTLAAGRLCLEQLVAKATRLAESTKDQPESQAVRWANALARQCQSALDELTFLTPWTAVANISHELDGFQLNKIPNFA